MNLPNETRKVPFVIVVVLISFILGPKLVFGQSTGGGAGAGGAGGAGAGGVGGAGLEIFTQEVYRSMSNYTSVFKKVIKKELGYCVVDV